MQTIVELVIEKTGISEKQAQTVVQTVIDVLREKSPESLARQIDTLFTWDGNNMAKLAQNLLGKVDNWFDSK